MLDYNMLVKWNTITVHLMDNYSYMEQVKYSITVHLTKQAKMHTMYGHTQLNIQNSITVNSIVLVNLY